VSKPKLAAISIMGVLILCAGNLSASECSNDDWNDVCPAGTSSLVMSDRDESGDIVCDFFCDDGHNLPIPRIDCFRGGKNNNSYSCEVWPRGEGLVYEWSSNGLTTFSITGDTELVHQQVFCPATSMVATVFLSVATPSGASKSASFFLSCGKNAELLLQGRERSINP
jgi:hypothetical protein